MNEFSHLLEEDEQIIDVMKPKKLPYMFKPCIACILFGIASVIFFIQGANSELSTRMFDINGCIFLGIGCLLLLVSNFKYSGCLYCITNKKIIIRSGIIGKDFRVLDLESITTVDVIVGVSDKLCKKNTGSLLFFNTSNFLYNVEGKNTGYSKNGFLHIENFNETYKKIKSLMRGVKEK